MTLYSHNGSYPNRLPNRIRLANGSTRTDSSTFTTEELLDAGFVEVSEPPQADYPNKLDWDGTDWVVREPNEIDTAQRWLEIQSECVNRLSETDYKVIKAYEANQPVDPAYVIYRQAIRDIYNNVNSIDPWNVQWPTLEVQGVQDGA